MNTKFLLVLTTLLIILPVCVPDIQILAVHPTLHRYQNDLETHQPETRVFLDQQRIILGNR